MRTDRQTVTLIAMLCNTPRGEVTESFEVWRILLEMINLKEASLKRNASEVGLC